MFYTFDQNNSRGSFVVNDNVAHYVIVEANSTDEANDIAESHGLYFDGCETGEDCSCCGDRWSKAYTGTSQPEVYGLNPLDSSYPNKENINSKWNDVIIYYKAGKATIKCKNEKTIDMPDDLKAALL